MKKLSQLTKILTLLLISGFIFSCAQSDQVVTNSFIQKRKYNKGFYIAKNSKNDKVEKTNKNVVDQKAVQTETASVTPTPKSENLVATAAVTTSPVVIAKEETTSKVATTSSERATEIIVEDAALSKKAQRIIKKIEKASVKANLKADPASPAPAAAGSGKSQLIALILVLVVGGLGIHRFYLGYTWQGVVQLLTAGGCGVWALIDLVRIIMGTLQPASGSYETTI